MNAEDLRHVQEKLANAKVHLNALLSDDLVERFPCWGLRRRTLRLFKDLLDICDAMFVEIVNRRR